MIHENVDLTGPTRGASPAGERPLGPLRLQGDHGPIAFRNIRYKPYSRDRLTLTGRGRVPGSRVPFREGFSSGVLRQVWRSDGSMFVGMTNRGWSSTGRAPYSLQRLVWTGRTPFEARQIEARPDGFEITFTVPVDRVSAADPSAYGVTEGDRHVRRHPPQQEQSHQG